MKRIIEPTADGSATLYVPELDEHYHSVKGAFTESQHIFIDMGLKACPVAHPYILEVGFGTGLNALLSLLEAERSGRSLHYTALELYPLPWETVRQMGYERDERLTVNGERLTVNDERLMVSGEQEELSTVKGERLTMNDEQVAGWFEALHTAPWEEEVQITPRFTLLKVHTDFTNGERLAVNGERLMVSDERMDSYAQPIHHSPFTVHRSSFPVHHSPFTAPRSPFTVHHSPFTVNPSPLIIHRYSLVYFDAFAPEKQPEMWTQELFHRLHVSMEEGGLLTTYCAKGAVRRMLQAAGFVVERLPGPPGGKREILRATACPAADR